MTYALQCVLFFYSAFHFSCEIRAFASKFHDVMVGNLWRTNRR